MKANQWTIIMMGFYSRLPFYFKSFYPFRYPRKKIGRQLFKTVIVSWIIVSRDASLSRMRHNREKHWHLLRERERIKTTFNNYANISEGYQMKSMRANYSWRKTLKLPPGLLWRWAIKSDGASGFIITSFTTVQPRNCSSCDKDEDGRRHWNCDQICCDVGAGYKIGRCRWLHHHISHHRPTKQLLLVRKRWTPRR